MAKKAKKVKSKCGLQLSVVNPNAAGIDVSSTEMQVCVPSDRDGDNNRRFGTFTEYLRYISSWLKACKIDTVATADVIAKSLVGNWDEDLLFMLKQSFELYHYQQNQMKECDKQIEKILQEYIATLPPAGKGGECPRAAKAKSKKNEIFIDIEDYAYKVFGVNLMHMQGISDGALLRLVGELGHNFTDSFESYKKFCCWANITPNNKISGGKILSSKVPKRKNPVGLILRASANSLKASKSPLGFYFRRIQAKSGYLPAIIATANKLGRILYTLAKTKNQYNNEHLKTSENERLKKRLDKIQKEMEKIKNQLNECA